VSASMTYFLLTLAERIGRDEDRKAPPPCACSPLPLSLAVALAFPLLDPAFADPRPPSSSVVASLFSSISSSTSLEESPFREDASLSSDLRYRNPILSAKTHPETRMRTQTTCILHTVQARIPGSATTAPPAKAEHRLFVCAGLSLVLLNVVVA